MYDATSIDRIVELQEQVGRLRRSLKEARQELEGLMGMLLAHPGAAAKTRVWQGSTRRIATVPTTTPVVPTLSKDPKKYNTMEQTLRNFEVFDLYAVVNYARLRSDWRNGRVSSQLHVALRPIISERTSLKVRVVR